MTRRRSTRVEAGRFYGRTDSGELVPIPPAPPDVWICRRVADFPDKQVPPGGATAVCSRCDQVIAFNPARVSQVPPGTPKICLQCAEIEPLPIEP